ncbi:MAG: 50S ribosomal protein L30 [Thermoanaerobaculia bacterium]
MSAKAKESARMLRLQQVRSGIGCPVEMRETLKALGLRRMHQISERPDTKETRGMIAKINHLVRVVEER